MVWRSSKGKDSFGVNVGHPIVTNGDCSVVLFSALRGGDAARARRKLLWISSVR